MLHVVRTQVLLQRLGGAMTIHLLLAGTAVAASSETRAVEVAIGWVGVNPRSSSTPLRIVEVNGQSVSIEQPGTGVRITSTRTAIFTASYALDERWWLQAVLGWPVDQELQGSGMLGSVGTIGKGQQLSPALLIKHRFRSPGMPLRPFVSVGATYTTYRHSRVTNDAFRVATFGSQSRVTASGSSSLSPVVNAGVDLQLGERWFLSGAVAYNPIRTTLTLMAEDTPQGSVKTTVDTKLRSRAAALMVGYSF